MTAVLIFTETGTQYPISLDDVDSIIREYPITSKRTNGSQSRFTIKGEYPACVVANVRSDAHAALDAAYRGYRAEARELARVARNG